MRCDPALLFVFVDLLRSSCRNELRPSWSIWRRNSSILRIVLHHSKHDTLSMDDRSTFLCPSCETVVTISKTPDGTWNACCPNIACHAEFSKEQIAQIFAGTPMKSVVEERA